ncbi:sterol esterase [Malassezia sp. CBS 17886]|nr:sterol esterase [Malassezia sp. CBS 17886]
MASRPVSNRRRNYSQRTNDALVDVDEHTGDVADGAPGYAAEPGYTAEPGYAAEPEYAAERMPEPVAYGTQEPGGYANEWQDTASTTGRPSGDFVDARGAGEDEFEDAPAAPSEYGGGGAYEPYGAPRTRFEEYATPGTAYDPYADADGAHSLSTPGTPYEPVASDRAVPEGHDVFVERPMTVAEQSGTATPAADDKYYFDPTQPRPDVNEDVGGFPAFFNHPVGEYGDFSIFARLYLEIRQMFSFGVTSMSLGFVGFLAFWRYLNPFRTHASKAKTDREYERRITGERLSERVGYYAEYWGYACEEYEMTTRGGWHLKMQRISDPRRPGGRGYPVILQHGILCSSLFFFTSEERSLAFWLVDQGFDVWATNIRSNFGAGHVQYSRWDPRFWAWGMMEIADDLVEVVHYILGVTGHNQLAFVGHSQGTASMFLALSYGKYPELGSKLSSYTALGPAVFPGPALSRFPFRVMQMFKSRWAWSTIFGVRDFMPVLGLARQILPAFLYGHAAFVIFAYLFDFHDHNLIERQKPKIFRATGIQTSSELLYFYMRSFVQRGCIFDPNTPTPWFPPSFPPLTVVYGTADMLVLGKPLIDRLMGFERNVEIVHILEMQGYEHMDMVDGVDTWKVVFPKIKDTILRTMDLEDVPMDMKE